MSPWLGQLGVGSLGLALAVVLFRPLFFLWRRRPLASYRLAVVLLAGALLLPLGQLGIERWRGAKELGPVRRLAAALRFVGEADTASPGPQPDPEDALAALTVEELDRLLAALESEENALESAVPEPIPPALTTRPSPWARARALAARVPGGPLALLGGIYLAGLALALLRALRRLRRTRALVSAAEPITDPLVLSVWNELSAGSPLASRVRLFASPEVSAPMCFGMERPFILLPDAPDPSLDPDVLACVLLHELVHLERRDTWVMLGQELLRALFWFHPAAWWLSRRLDFLRELSCDLLVVARTGRRRRYAEALLEYATWMGRALSAHRPASTALLSWSGSKSQLSRRIEMLVSLPSRRSFPWTGIPAAVSLASCLWGGQLAAAAALTPAQEARQEPAPPARPEPAPALVPAPVEPVLAPLAEPRPVLERSPAPVASPEPVPALAPEPPSVAGLAGLAGLPPLAAPLQGETPTIGIVLGEVSAERARAIGRPAESLMAIQGIVPGSRAERAELRAGDVIATIDGEPATLERLGIAKRRLPAGTIRLGIHRDGSWFEVRVGGQGQDRPAGDALGRLRALGYAGQAAQDARAQADAGRQGIQAAREALERALALNPDDAGVRSALEALQRAQDEGAPARAIQEYQNQAPRRQLEDRRALLEHAKRLMEEGDLQAAREALERAKALGAARRRGTEAPPERQEVMERRAQTPEELQRIYQEQKQFLQRQQERGVERREQQDAPREVQRRALEERTRQYLERQRGAERGDGGEARREALEAELRRTEALLEQRRAEIEALRARIEELRRAQREGARGLGGSGLPSRGLAPGGGAPGPRTPKRPPGAGRSVGPQPPMGHPGPGPSSGPGSPSAGPSAGPGSPGTGPSAAPSSGGLPGAAADAGVVTEPPEPPGPVSIGRGIQVRAGTVTPIPDGARGD